MKLQPCVTALLLSVVFIAGCDESLRGRAKDDLEKRFAILTGLVSNISEADYAEVAEYHIKSLELNLKVYRLDNYVYPTSEQGLSALVEPSTIEPRPRNFKAGGYTLMFLTADRIPLDPWGVEYHYRSPGNYGEIDIFTLGSDGQEGGSGSAADIGNWMFEDSVPVKTDIVLAWARRQAAN